jgi:hypothetical protein
MWCEYEKKLEKSFFFFFPFAPSLFDFDMWSSLSRTTNCLNASWSFFGNTRFFGTTGAACAVVALPLTAARRPPNRRSAQTTLRRFAKQTKSSQSSLFFGRLLL